MISRQEIELARRNKSIGAVYEDLVVELIRQRYSISQELAIIRQRDVKSEEFSVYNEYAEECKATAKRMLEE